MKKICVLNYGIGNLRSVSNAVAAVGAKPLIAHERARIADTDGMIIPGVGAFPQCMGSLQATDLVDEVKAYIASGRPVLGICVGMQLLFDRGTEFSPTEGLGIIPGTVDRIPISREEGRLPHIAWTHVDPTGQGATTLFANLDRDARRFYFVHSYAASEVAPHYVSGTAAYHGYSIIAAVQKENVWGTQFHPEKSGPSGLRLLGNFIERC